MIITITSMITKNFSRLLGKNERADSLVGTAEYLAPEVIKGEEYGFR